MTKSSVAYLGTMMLFAQVLAGQGCGSNTSSLPPEGTGGAMVSNGGTTSPATTGAGGATTPVTTGAGGATTPGTNSSDAAVAPIDGAGGDFTPSCTGLTTAAGAAPTKNGACTASDPQLCYKTCGPQSIGFKSETCSAGVYNEQSGCSFQTGSDYSCYKIPATADASCPTTAPQASQVCTIAQCVVCGGTKTAQTTGYLDSTGAAKAGYCVCQAPGASGSSKWSCASSTAWPCPAGQGC